MRRLPVPSIFLLLALATSAAASPRMLPQPPPRPLAVLVRDSRTIHVLSVEAVNLKGVTFKAETALKGKTDEVPFRFLELMSEVRRKDLFRAGDTVLCFCQGNAASQEGDAVGVLYVKGRW